METDRLLNTIVMVTVFGLVFSVWCICVFLWLGRYLLHLKTVQKRLGITENKESEETRTLRLWSEMQQQGSEHDSSPAKPSIRQRLEILRCDAGWKRPAWTVLFRLVGAVILGFVVTYFAGGGILLASGIAGLILVGFVVYTQHSISKREELFERQLVDALGIAGRALRAGHPLVGAFQLVSEEIDEPLGNVFFRICQEQSLGLDLKDSIRNVAKTNRNAELKLFATAVAIQFQNGGNLADLMDSLTVVIRARMKLNRRVKVITSQTQFSKRILIAMPILLFFGLNFMNPEYMDTMYTTPEGNWLLAGVVVSMLLGIWMMNRLSILRY